MAYAAQGGISPKKRAGSSPAAETSPLLLARLQRNLVGRPGEQLHARAGLGQHYSLAKTCTDSEENDVVKACYGAADAISSSSSSTKVVTAFSVSSTSETTVAAALNTDTGPRIVPALRAAQ